jgi:hypothetical protein
MVIDVDEWVGGHVAKEGMQGSAFGKKEKEGDAGCDGGDGGGEAMLPAPTISGSKVMRLRQNLIGAGEAMVLSMYLRRAHKSVTGIGECRSPSRYSRWWGGI